MPLIQGKSKKSFQKNMETEMHAGKPKDQSLAIAYSVQRKNKKKKMAHGGEVDLRKESMSGIDDAMDSREMEMAPAAKMKKKSELDLREEKMAGIDSEYDSRDEDMLDSKPMRHEMEDTANEDDMTDIDEAKTDRDLMMLAKGGMIDMDEEEEHPKSIAEAILRKKKKAMYADGGEVDIEENMSEEPNHEDDMSYKLLRKRPFMGDDLQRMKGQPMDSNETGRDLEDEDKYDMIDRIRRKMKMYR